MSSLFYRPLCENYLTEHVDEFLKIENQYHLPPIWDKKNYLFPIESKYRYSVYVKNDSTLIGFIISSKKDFCFHIHRFIINQESNNKGVGNKLFEFFLKNIEESSYKITLKVHTENKNALRFYLNNGFKEVEKNQTHVSLLLEKG